MKPSLHGLTNRLAYTGNAHLKKCFYTSPLTFQCAFNIAFYCRKIIPGLADPVWLNQNSLCLSPSFSTKVKGSVSQPSSRLAGWTSRCPYMHTVFLPGSDPKRPRTMGGRGISSPEGSCSHKYKNHRTSSLLFQTWAACNQPYHLLLPNVH